MRLKTRLTEVQIDLDEKSYICMRELPQDKYLSYFDGIETDKEGKIIKNRENILKFNRNIPEIFKSMVTGWSGIEDEDGNPLACDDGNKDLVCKHEQRFVMDIVSIANALIKEKKEDLEKKLNSGLAGILLKGEPHAKNVEPEDYVNVEVAQSLE